MARFGLVGPAYRSQSINADCQTCMNLYLETIESGQGKGPAALYCTPGLALLYNLGAAAVRGLITAQGRTFAVAGTVLWELLAPTASPNKISRGNVISDGLPVSMAYGPTQVLIASGGNLYCYQLVAGTTTNATGSILAANTLTQIPQFSAATGYGLLQTNVAQVVYSDGFFISLFANSNQLQQSNPLDGSSWQGVAQTIVSVFSDNVVGIHVDHRLLWVMGRNAIQPYFNSGNFPFAFDIVQGGFIEQGLAAGFGKTKADNSLFWWGADERGSGIFWRANGYQPVRVSTHAIEYELSTYSTIADAFTFAYQEQGHTILQTSFPSAEKTWDYDCATQSWHQRGFWNTQAGIFTRSRAQYHTFNFGMHLVGDPTTGAVYQQASSIFSDFGNPIRRIRTAPHISKEQSRIFYTKLQVDVETGIGPTFPGQAIPTIMLVKDANGALRNFQMGENGILQAPLNPAGNIATLGTLFLNDQKNTTSWQVTVNAFGEITPVLQATFNAGYPQSIPFVTVEGDQSWVLEIENLGGGIGVLQTIPQGIIGRGPLMAMQRSNDGGRTWSSESFRDCGQGGETIKRVIWNREGSARDRVYRLIMTDPIPWRIIDGYLFTDPEDAVPTSRYATEMRKRA